MALTGLKLHGYWRSGTSYRARIMLELKDIAYENLPVNLIERAHKTDAYLARNPMGLVPALELSDGTFIHQSPAIMEYIESLHPSPSMIGHNAIEAAEIRARAMIIGCDTHPIGNLRILNYLKSEFDADQTAIEKWQQTWMAQSFAALESIIDDESDYTFGNAPSMADCYVIPQIYGAKRFNVDLDPYPKLTRIYDHCTNQPAFKRAAPENQIDAV